MITTSPDASAIPVRIAAPLPKFSVERWLDDAGAGVLAEHLGCPIGRAVIDHDNFF